MTDKYTKRSNTGKSFCILWTSSPNWRTDLRIKIIYLWAVFGVHSINRPPTLALSYLVPSVPKWFDGSISVLVNCLPLSAGNAISNVLRIVFQYPVMTFESFCKGPQMQFPGVQTSKIQKKLGAVPLHPVWGAYSAPDPLLFCSAASQHRDWLPSPRILFNCRLVSD